MHLSRQIFAQSLQRPADFRLQRTSTLLSQGLVAYPIGTGFPAYSPLGIDMLARIEELFTIAAVRGGYDRFRIPHLMRNDDLQLGEPIGDQFRSKVFFLQGSLDGYHLLTTPEMMFVRMLRSSRPSYRSFPVRCTYTTSIFRQVKQTRSIITCREFRVFGLLSLDTEMAGVVAGLESIMSLARSVMASLGVSVQETRQETPLKSELMFPCFEGDTYLGRGDSRKRALSLAIGYQYGADSLIPIVYQSRTNTLENPLMVSFALCTNRLLFSVFDAHRDELGFALPASIRPLEVVLIPRAQTDLLLSESVMSMLAASSIRVALDDRMSLRISDRQAFSEYVGAAASVVVHSGLLHITRRGDQLSYGSGTDPEQVVALISSMLRGGV